jgi:hypothetical protein
MSVESQPAAAAQDARGARPWLPVAILASAQFVMSARAGSPRP